jgi:quercetin dioxygenase-like cupin family protein
MVFDFNSEEFVSIPNFKGGEGHFDAKMHDDGKCKIIFGKIEPGCTSGYHAHEANAEIIYMISGEAIVDYDGTEETIHAGQAHYCPEGHSHSMRNASETEPAVMFCVVPEHHLG